MSKPTQREYWCFISYRHLDNREEGRQWASWLHHELETYRIPSDLAGRPNRDGEIIPASIFPVFRDEEELSSGNLTEKIYRALTPEKQPAERRVIPVDNSQGCAVRRGNFHAGRFVHFGQADDDVHV